MCNADHAVGSIMTDYMRQRILKMHFWQAHLVSIATRNRQVDYMTTFIIISHRIIHYGIQQMHSIILTGHGTGSLGHRVNGSSFTSGSPGHHSDPVWDPSFSGFRKKCTKCRTYIWNAEMTKVVVRCLLLDWNHWMSVHAMNFYFYLWL